MSTAAIVPSSFPLGRLAIFALGATLWPALAAPAALSPGAERYPLENYLTRLAETQWAQRDAQIAKVKTAEDVKRRAAYIRTKFLEGIGQLPERGGDLNVRITGKFERQGYRVENIIYESLPGCHVTANLYIPTSGKGPFPAVLGAAGHSMVEGKGAEPYQKAWILLAQQGHVVLAYDPPAQGERFEVVDPVTGAVTSGSHISPGLHCLLTGGTAARYFLWDAIRGLDYLLTRSEVDPKRIAAAGNSGGGTQSAFLAVVEPRLTAAAPSCYWTSWRKLWWPAGPQDSEQVVPNWIQAGLDFSDLAIAFSPKPIIMLTATKDSFPVQGARDMHAEAKAMFALLGAEKAMGYFEFNDGHGWSQPRREAAAMWFNQWFYGKSEPVKEPANTIEKLETLRCTETGHVITSMRSKTVQALNLEVADSIYPRRTLRTASNPSAARATVGKRIALSAKRTTPTASKSERLTRDGFSVDRVTLVPEPGIELRAAIVGPEGAAKRRPAVIILREYAMPGNLESDADVEGWRKAGYVVVVGEVRGLLPALETKPYYTTNYKTSMRALLLGKTMVGMRVQDTLALYDYAASLPSIAPDNITLVGRGNSGVLAQYAAALEPKLRHVIAAGSMISYMDLVRSPRCSERFVDLIAPGVLLDFDLPDLGAIAGKGRITLVNPIDAQAAPLTESAAKSGYAGAKVVVSTLPVGPELLK